MGGAAVPPGVGELWELRRLRPPAPWSAAGGPGLPEGSPVNAAVSGRARPAACRCCGRGGGGEGPVRRAGVVPLPRAATGNRDIAAAFTRLDLVRETGELRLGVEIENHMEPALVHLFF